MTKPENPHKTCVSRKINRRVRERFEPGRRTNQPDGGSSGCRSSRVEGGPCDAWRKMTRSRLDLWDERSFEPAAGESTFVLGAGFSRAVDSRMPLTDELGNLCLPLLTPHLPPDGPKQFSGGFFETYLSALAADQPFLDSAENGENHALFERFSSAIGTILGTRQQEVLAAQPPPWLVGLAVVAHTLRAGVVTFNYDTLMECLVDSPFGPLDDAHGEGRFDPFFWDELTGGVPAWPPGPARLAGTRRETMRLLKLHGSLNWYWSPGDSTGATVAKRGLPGSWLHPAVYEEGDRQRELPGRVPFLVPPTATKSPFYNSPQLREFWQQARQRLEAASHVFLLGYSLPATDTTTGTMLRSSIGTTSSTVVVADLNPEPVIDRLKALGVSPARIKVVPEISDSPVRDLCELIALAMSRRALDSLRSAVASAPLVVSWGNHCQAIVRDVHTNADEVRLVLDAPVASLSTINQDAGAQVRLQTDLDAPPAARLIAVLPDGGEQAVIDHSTVSFSTGRGSWTVLRAAGPSPLLKEM